jgi:hypothetical protein
MKINAGDILVSYSDVKYLVISGNKTGIIENTGKGKLYNSFSQQQSGEKTEYITIFDGKFVNKISISDIDRLYKNIINSSEEVINHFKQLY